MAFYEDTLNEVFDDNSTGNENIMKDQKSLDLGYNKIWGFIERSDGSWKRSKIEVYTTGGIGSNIRNAETGEYYKEIVGSKDEDLYFKMKMSTGELTSKNGSNTLFYTSPDHCMRHLHIEIPQDIINSWLISSRQQQNIKNSKQKKTHVIVK
jgi:hypothetical protein